ncbi:MAG TPA: hypothetical protein VG842_05965, partial [Sediminibacterium sp.]|nr:hypothetical protein [Sediminibacterium sp.]
MSPVKQFALLTVYLIFSQVKAQGPVSTQKTGSIFTLADTQTQPVILTDSSDDWLVNKAAVLLQSDIAEVSGQSLTISHHLPPGTKNIVLIGSIAHSAFIRQLAAEHRLTTSSLNDQWEAYRISVVANPFPGVAKALVIAGSDKRGAAYGVFELSRLIGVSPWYWWADVPVQ